MSTPLVSVGISFLNSESCLLNSIRSVFAQTYSNWELILVDDGSTDDSLAVAHSIDDPRVRVLAADGENRQLPARLNQIIQASRGDYIARMDADDICHPERLAREVEFLGAHPKVDVVGSCSCILGEQGQPVNKLIVPRTHEEIFRNKFKGSIAIVHPSIMARAEWFRRRLYDESSIGCEDMELWLRSCNDSVFASIPDVLCFKDEFLSFGIRKYAKSRHTVARIIWRYAQSELGAFAAAYCVGSYVCKRYLKIGLFAAAKILGLHNKLISRRYSRLTSQEFAEMSAVIDAVKKADVPIRSIT